MISDLFRGLLMSKRRRNLIQPAPRGLFVSALIHPLPEVSPDRETKRGLTQYAFLLTVSPSQPATEAR